MGSLRVAVTQAEPVWLDLAGSVQKTCNLIVEAAKGGAKLIAFPECWVPGYPPWIWYVPGTHPIDFEFNVKYSMNALVVDSPEMKQICAAAGENSIVVVLGFTERGETGSLYISQAIISLKGELLMHRRKIKPTHMERTVFGDGSGNDLKNVVEIDFGGDVGKVKIGCLNCWEHTWPLLKYHTYSQGEVIHISSWPPLQPPPADDAPGMWSMSDAGTRTLAQAYAIEGGGFVLLSSMVFTEKGVETFRMEGNPLFAKGGGYSAAIAPDGRLITKPLGRPDEEGIVYADLDLTKVIANRSFTDVVGHYSRPDLLWLGYDDEQKEVKRKAVAVRGDA
ncbi:carbon-nitrogen hydrolase [Rhizodiscina lignyota]|uniref:nitrilase n=1 Tax=Rhizodiscina lignyota TaxID=1504668 RepID=A0A9P4MAL7_9PEZI|nr:carbon-nitrogen hydrolase [Rhizodiscina lignyota]